MMMVSDQIVAMFVAYKVWSMIFGVILFCVAVGFLKSAFKTSKSKEYRELLGDMYVAGKIKQFAEEDNIDLVKELKDFTKFLKVKNLSTKDLDDAVEAELKEKISKSNEEKLGKD